MAPQLVMILLLVFLEVMLSMDNALAIAALVRHLPHQKRVRALTYGVWGAIGFRIIALFFLQEVLTSQWLRFAGAAYLLYMSAKYFFWDKDEDEKEIKKEAIQHFWKIVVMVEITDIAFSVDSILASVTVSNVFMVTAIGAVAGILSMRFAASFFAGLMNLFPRLEDAAYILITAAGGKLLFEGLLHVEIPEVLFYTLLICCFAYGFTKKRKRV
jgi:YkoY family integral membrane protein